ncbi:hypothetical protein PIB30_041722 [Stylosanthes scabra]|uniref:GATA-type domain-containing protein n=1 Tax=Stylosanthes scabra TaxID=79078 RepID=A0ABU6XCP1_9FABA|nr:hypothetical protein [Stylosanthes scabra]
MIDQSGWMVMMDLNKEWSCEELSESKKCCSDCKTTKTPLWRGGPAGPKTLCNACGIRYRKRRASTVAVSKGQERKRERSQNGGGSSSSSSSDVDDLKESLKVNLMALGEEFWLQRSAATSVLKKKQRSMCLLGEEEQAAVCLMALSSGYVFA